MGHQLRINHMGLEKPHLHNEPGPGHQETVKSEEEILWERQRAEVDKIADRLGLGIDEKIKKAVTAFRVYEFPTDGSCEGHAVGDGHGLPFPWIDIDSPEPKGLRKATGEEKEEKERMMTMENLRQQQKMIALLEEFYRDRETPFEARLAFDSRGIFGGFRVQSFGAEVMKLLTPEEQIQKLELYRKELNDFSDFLKIKYFSKE